MDIIPQNQRRQRSLWLVIGAVTVIAVIGIAALYLSGRLNGPTAVTPAVHEDGMAHTAGMEHDPAMDHLMNERQQEVAERGSEVMPFDLERTTHVFSKTEDGGLQQVRSDDGDPEQIALIQAHLEEEALRFQQADFDDPAHIHGDDMPGLALLRAGYEQVEVVYAPLTDGAQISYQAETPELIAAIHAWFDAQLADHGPHASP
jgi:hypothetical protein